MQLREGYSGAPALDGTIAAAEMAYGDGRGGVLTGEDPF